MNRRFLNCISELHKQYEALIAMKPVRIKKLPSSVPKSGVYLLSDGRTHLYVGKSRDLRARLRAHVSGDPIFPKATLATYLARDDPKRIVQSWQADLPKRTLIADCHYQDAFERAKKRVGNLMLRYVEEKDPVRRTLLEIYVWMGLDTEYNDFENTG